MPIEIIHTADALEKYHQAWDDLVKAALQPNVFYEPWMLLPAFRMLAPRNVSIVLIWDDQDPGLLTGLFPLQKSDRFKRRLPFRHWLTWRHAYCYSGAPLVRRGGEQFCLQQIFAWCDQQHGLALTFSLLSDDVLYEAIKVYSRVHGRYLNESNRHERALLDSDLPGVAYIEDAVRKKKRKEFARLRRRLEELGSVQLQEYQSGSDDIEAWLDDFFGLEAQGWKGDVGTAITLNAQEKAFVISAVRSAANSGRLLFYRLCLEQRSLASIILFTDDKACFAFKIAYDESFGQYSPGVLLMLDVTVLLQDRKKRMWVDSCAVPDHPMINHIWRQRRLMVSPQVSLRHWLAKPVFMAMGLIKFFRNTFS